MILDSLDLIESDLANFKDQDQNEVTMQKRLKNLNLKLNGIHMPKKLLLKLTHCIQILEHGLNIEERD